jgi:serine protease AprX
VPRGRSRREQRSGGRRVGWQLRANFTGCAGHGSITSPGSCPSAITVGAVDTLGTTDRSDDRVAPYSSRGPTPFDFAVKPDLVAPGTRIVSLEASGSLLAATYPSWHVAGSAKNAYFRLSGSSMASAVVSGGVALLLDAEPNLTPAQVKLALQMGARFVSDAGLVGGGAGSVDFDASLRIARQGLLNSLSNTLSNLLGLSSGASYRDRGTLIDRVYDRTGIRLLGLLDLSALLGSADSAEYGVLNLLGLTNPLANTPANYLVWGERAGWTNSYYVVWGTTMQSPDGEYVVWGTSDDGEYVVWGTGGVGGQGR